jgi:hypothetical protein
MLPSLSLLSWLALGPAQVSPAAQESSEPRARTTVLHLEGGTVLRTKARERDGSWEVFMSGEWQPAASSPRPMPRSPACRTRP